MAISFLKNVGWNSIAVFGVQAIQMILLSITARFLSPENFGLYAVVIVFINFFNLFSEWGVSPYIIQKKSLSVNEVSSLFYFNLALGIVLGLTFVGVSPFITHIYQKPELLELLYWSALLFVLNALISVPRALIEKSLKFQLVAVIEVSACLISSVICVFLVVSGFGTLSLVIQALVFAALRAGGYFVFSHFIPVSDLNWRDVSASFRFTLSLLAFNFVNYFSRNLDQLVIGKWLGASLLGHYSLAYKLMLFPVQKIAGVFVRVLLPTLSANRKAKKLQQESYISAVKNICFITFPFMSAVSVFADDIVLVFLGQQWGMAAEIIKVLAFVGMLQSLITTVGALYMANDSTGLMLRMGALTSTIVIVGVIIGINWGLLGVAYGLLIATALMCLPNFYVALKLIGLPLSEFLKSIAPPCTLAACVYFLGISMQKLLLNELSLMTRASFEAILLLIIFGVVFKYRRYL